MDVFPAEVLVEHYGWEVERPLYKRTAADVRADKYGGERDYSPRRDGGFSKKTLGASEYTKGRVAVMRAFDRLEDRGLLTVYTMLDGFGIPRGKAAMLTDDGVEKARELVQTTQGVK
jgi:hypothetical protein